MEPEWAKGLATVQERAWALAWMKAWATAWEMP
jgi:hypothetical protein